MVSFLFLFACIREDRPEYLVPQEKLVPFLADVYSTEAKVTGMTLARDSAEVLFSLAERRLFEMHSINDSLYRLTMQYYLGHPREMGELYDGLIDTLNLREQKTLPGSGSIK